MKDQNQNPERVTQIYSHQINSPLPPLSDIHVALLAPEIPGNTGNIGRSCLATGAKLHLIRPLGFSLEERYLRRAGLDYWQHVQPTIWPSWSAFEKNLPNLGQAYFFSTEAPRSFWQAEIERPCVLIFGSESNGLPPEVRQQYADQFVSIPMQPGPVRSLNLSTSVGIALYEAGRLNH